MRVALVHDQLSEFGPSHPLCHSRGLRPRVVVSLRRAGGAEL